MIVYINYSMLHFFQENKLLRHLNHAHLSFVQAWKRPKHRSDIYFVLLNWNRDLPTDPHPILLSDMDLAPMKQIILNPNRSESGSGWELLNWRVIILKVCKKNAVLQYYLSALLYFIAEMWICSCGATFLYKIADWWKNWDCGYAVEDQHLFKKLQTGEKIMLTRIWRCGPTFL
jgi:hypothetical protein